MNTTTEMLAADRTHGASPPPTSPELKPTAMNGDDLYLLTTTNLNSEPESEDQKEKEMDEESPSCSSTYSSSDSDSDFFQINPPELDHTPPSPTAAGDLNPLAVEKITNPDGEKPPGPEIERRSPSIQTMVRDPNRIPSSIFARTTATPMDWSVASNESLFSIHMGNASFSKDQAFLAGRSGELRGFGSGTTERPPPWISPDLKAEGAGKREMGGLAVEMDEAAAASVNAEAMREVMRAAAEGKESEKKVVLGRSLSRHSDGSTTSFAFPMYVLLPSLFFYITQVFICL